LTDQPLLVREDRRLDYIVNWNLRDSAKADHDLERLPSDRSKVERRNRDLEKA
jgi:hypothetical protein